MKLAEYTKPIQTLGIFTEAFSEGETELERPIKEQRKGDFRYGDSSDKKLAQERFLKLHRRTGAQIAKKVIEIVPKNCGVCHEVKSSGCPEPFSCTLSPLNPHCVHTDNAGVYPFLESMLWALYVGGVIDETDFASSVAWMRVLSRKKMFLDWISRNNQLDRVYYSKIFDGDHHSAEEIENLPILERNIIMQGYFNSRINAFLDACIAKITWGFQQEWNPENDRRPLQSVAQAVISTAIRIEKVFWTSDPPGVHLGTPTS